MIDKQEIAKWLRSGAKCCDSGLRLGMCEICGKEILRGDFYFSRGERHAHMNCVLSEDTIRELEIERGEREPDKQQ